MKRALSLILLLATFAVGQGTQEEPLLQRVRLYLRLHGNLPAGATITLTPLQPSEILGYKRFDAVVGGAEHSSLYHLYLNDDGRHLARLVESDLPSVTAVDIKGRPFLGGKDAAVTIVVFDDLQCPFCSRHHQSLLELHKKYCDRIKIVYKDNPLPFHPWARHAAADANCLASLNSGAYWKFVDFVHENFTQMSEVRGDADEKRAQTLGEALKSDSKDVDPAFGNLDTIARHFAREERVDLPRLDACLKSPDLTAVDRSAAEAEKAGASGTPYTLVNGLPTSGAQPLEALEDMVDVALLDAGQKPPSATTSQGKPVK